MAFLGQTYEPVTEPPQNEFEPLPSGEYLGIIIDSEMKATKNGSGQYLELTYQVIDGPMKGRKVWSRLNLLNQNAKAQEIAQRDFASIRYACNVGNINDSVQLHNIPHVIRVEFVPANPTKGQNRDGNEIRGWKRAEGVAAPAGQPAPSPFAQQPGQPAAPAGAPGWARKPEAA